MTELPEPVHLLSSVHSAHAAVQGVKRKPRASALTNEVGGVVPFWSDPSQSRLATGEKTISGTCGHWLCDRKRDFVLSSYLSAISE